MVRSFRFLSFAVLSAFLLLPLAAGQTTGPHAGIAAAAGRVSSGAPAPASRLGVLRSLADGVRALIAPEAGIGGLLLLSGVAAAYGVVHALGPGHQKSLVAGLLGSAGGGPGQAALAAAVAAGSHALSVVLLFGGLSIAAKAPAPTRIAGYVLERLPAVVLAIIAARMLVLRLGAAIARLRPSVRTDVASDARDHAQGGSGCSCADCSRSSATGADRQRGTLPAVLLGSLVPCPGAAAFLSYGFAAGNPLAGVLAVLALSAGMWAVLFAVGLAALAVRSSGLAAGARRGGRAAAVVRSAFEVGGSLAVLAFAFMLLA